MWCLHSADWWRRHWERTGIVDVGVADTLADGWRLWQAWQEEVCPDNTVEIRTIDEDRGRNLGYVRVIGRRRAGARLEEPTVSVPAGYSKAPLLRSPE